MNVGTKISELRRSLKLSQEQLAEKLNVTRQTISNWELGQTTPDILQAKEISKIFNVSLDELLDNDLKNIIVEKINNTEKSTTKIIKIFKILSISIIFFLIVIILINIPFIIKQNVKGNEYFEEAQSQSQNFYTHSYPIISSGTITADGFIATRLTVSSEYQNINFNWKCVSKDNANSSAKFKLSITGNEKNYTIYLPISDVFEEYKKSYEIGPLEEGTYDIFITPDLDTTGTYDYEYQIISY